MTRITRKKNELVQRLIRKGEGVHIATLRTPVTSSAGVTKEAVSIDMSSAQVPDRRYPADAVRVEVGEDMVRIFFAQRKPVGDGLQSILLIRVAFLGARQFLRSMEPIVGQVKAYLAKFNIRVPSQLDIKEAPNQTVTLDANIVAAGFSAREGCLDFYYVSPYAILGMRGGGDMYADPVVRVFVTTSNLVAIYDTLVANKASLPADELEEEL
jgi:hypothetical protein